MPATNKLRQLCPAPPMNDSFPHHLYQLLCLIAAQELQLPLGSTQVHTYNNQFDSSVYRLSHDLVTLMWIVPFRPLYSWSSGDGVDWMCLSRSDTLVVCD